MIKVGDSLPNLLLRTKTYKINEIYVNDFFSNKKVVLFALPGAFTPTCSAKHLPGYIDYFNDIINKGVDKVACLAVNDPHVMKAWAEVNKIDGKIEMLSDSDCSFSKAIGLYHNYGPVMNIRSLRFSMIVDDCVVKTLFVESIGKFEVSGADNILRYL